MVNDFYQRIMDEHKINREGAFVGNLRSTNDTALLNKTGTHFEFNKHNRYIPRAIFVDLDVEPVNKMRSSFFGSLMDTEHFVSPGSHHSLAGSLIWAQGHYTDGAEFIDDCLDNIRSSVEICDHLQGFQFMHSVAGGVGGGFGSLLVMKLREEYPDAILSDFCTYPSPWFHDERNSNIVAYNTVLSTHLMLENTDMNFVMDNGAILKGLRACLDKPTMQDINWFIGLALSNVTASFRFPTEPAVNCSLRKMHTALTALPRLNFFALSVAPFMSPKRPLNQLSDTPQLGDIKTCMTEYDITGIRPEDGKCINLHINCRTGDQSALDNMNEQVSQMLQRNSDDFVAWIPSNIQSYHVEDGGNLCYARFAPLIQTQIISTTSIKTVFQRLCAAFAKVYRRKAYLHWYKGEGMDEMEFQEADKNVRDLIAEYQLCQDVVDDSADSQDDKLDKNGGQEMEIENDPEFEADEEDGDF